MTAGRPNLLFIMSDDHGPNALGCYGASIARTPNLDQLADNGIRFMNALDTTALCAPSRAALLSGTYAHKNGFRRNGDIFDGSQTTLQSLLRDAGYETAIIGKWHLVSEPTGFDHYDVIPGHGRFWDCPFKSTDQPWQDGNKGGNVVPGYLTDVITDKAIDWLEQRNREKPFCLCVHHKSPHVPHEYPKRYEELFEDDLPTPATFDDDWSGRTALLNSAGKWSKLQHMIDGDLRGNELGDRGLPEPRGAEFRDFAYQTFYKGYYRLVASLDESVGRLLSYLDRASLNDDTIVVYTSDNGFFLGDHGLYNKMWMYEQALRLPFIVRLPGGRHAGTTRSHLTSLIDVAPTFLDYAGAGIPDHLQGRSLRPVIEAAVGETQFREAHYYHYYGQFDVPEHCGVRTRARKLAYFFGMDGDLGWELFDLKKDPMEMHNVAADHSYAGELREMKRVLRREMERVEDPRLGEVFQS
jgi:arylsulfatase A-like enzyme